MTYIINESLCCINPTTYVFHDDKDFRVDLAIAEYKGKWSYGYHIDYHGGLVGCGGHGMGVGFGKYREDIQFGSKEEAFNAGIQLLIKEIKRKGAHPNGRSNTVLLKAIDARINKQFELF